MIHCYQGILGKAKRQPLVQLLGTLSKGTQSHIAADQLKASYSVEVVIVFEHQCSVQYFQTF